MQNTVEQTGIRQPSERSGSPTDSPRIPSAGRSGATLFALVVFLVVLTLAASFLVGSGGGGRLAPAPTGTPGEIPSAHLVGIDAGAPPGYGLTNASGLQSRGPILIAGNGGFTSANGVRSGDGSAGNTYMISNWSIDGNLYAYTGFMIQIVNTTKYVVIENNRITNLNANSQYVGIEIGQYYAPNPDNPPYIPSTKNVVIQHNEIRSMHAYGIRANEGSWNIQVEQNFVILNANANWTYGICFMRNVHDSTISGNYVNARTDNNLLTVGIQVGDYQVSPDRPVTGVVVEQNTVTNATSMQIQIDDNVGTIVKYNLVFQNYPGMKKISGWPLRGIFVEWLSKNVQVYGNVAYGVERGIEIAAGYETVYSNTVHDVNYGVYVDVSGSFWEGRGVQNDTVYDTTYWNVSKQVFVVPANSNHTVLDVGPGVTPTNFSPIYFVANQTPSQITYAWGGQNLNVSMRLGSRLIYDHQTSSTSEELTGAWTGTNLKLQLSQFLPGDVVYSLQSATTASFAGHQFNSASNYSLYLAGQPLMMLTADVAGNLSFSMPGPVSGSYEIRFINSVPPPTVSIRSPSNNSYVTAPAAQISWIVNDLGAGLKSVTLNVDGTGSTDVTKVTSYTVSNLTDGRHTLTLTATDTTGLSASAYVRLIVDTHGPTIDILTPANNAMVGSTTVLIAWNATDAVSGVEGTTISLDHGPAVAATGENYSLVGLALGAHYVVVTAVDNVGLSTTATVSFSIQAPSGNAANSTSGSAGPAVVSIAYVPDASSVDIAFTQPMNQTSVEKAIMISPNVNYSFQWLNASRLQIVLHTSVTSGSVYQVVLQPSAKTSSGASLQHPFLFQFLISGSGSAQVATTWLPIVIFVIALLLAVNWATAGYLVLHYRKNAKRVKSTLTRFQSRYTGSLVIVYKKLATGTRRRQINVHKGVPKPLPPKVVPRKPK